MSRVGIPVETKHRKERNIKRSWEDDVNQWDATKVVAELVEGGYDKVLRQLHAQYQCGELTFRSVAAKLGLSVRDLYELLEQKGLPT